MKFMITGMTCEGCAHSVQNVITKIPGVKQVKVSLKDREAVVSMDDIVKADQIVRAVEEAGYGAQVK